MSSNKLVALTNICCEVVPAAHLWWWLLSHCLVCMSLVMNIRFSSPCTSGLIHKGNIMSQVTMLLLKHWWLTVACVSVWWFQFVLYDPISYMHYNPKDRKSWPLFLLTVLMALIYYLLSAKNSVKWCCIRFFM